MIETAIFNRVLVGLDEQRRSDCAIAAGIDLAEGLGARLALVHAVDLPQSFLSSLHADSSAVVYAEAIEAARTAQRRRLGGSAWCRAHLPLDELLVVRAGKPAKVLLDIAQPSDLVVLGPHASRGLLDFGSTLRTVLAEAPGCVWVQKQAPRKIERILVATDLSRDSFVAAHAARRLARALDAKVAVLHAFNPPVFAYPTGLGFPVSESMYTIDQQRDVARRHFEDAITRQEFGADASPIFREGESVDVILEEARDNDLVVVGSHGRTGLSHSVLGSVAYSVLKRADGPVLAVRHPGRRFQR